MNFKFDRRKDQMNQIKKVTKQVQFDEEYAPPKEQEVERLKVKLQDKARQRRNEGETSVSSHQTYKLKAQFQPKNL